MILLLTIFHIFLYFFPFKQNTPAGYGKRKTIESIRTFHLHPKKPKWVSKELIRMKAFMPDVGCRKLAESFNRRYARSKNMTVGKTYVSNIIKKHQYEIQLLRKNIKHRIPRPLPVNIVWGLDLTGKTDTQNKLHNILGIIDHGSRGCLCLKGLKNKASITLLRHILDAIELYGQPKIIRTDNETVFTSRLFCFGLSLLGIKHQKIDKGCPWQNGRVERFFGTLKEKLNQWDVNSRTQLNGALSQFRFWYNHVRPHQHLDGRTPAEVWQGIDIYQQKIKKDYFFNAWDGLLTGYFLKI